jgi:Protein of unknown function (DUF2795)
MARTSAADLAHGLKGAHFPISKGDLMKLARKNGAGEDVLETMKELPNDDYASVAEVEKAFGELNREEGGSGRQKTGGGAKAAQKGGHHSHGGRTER